MNWMQIVHLVLKLWTCIGQVSRWTARLRRKQWDIFSHIIQMSSLSIWISLPAEKSCHTHTIWRNVYLLNVRTKKADGKMLTSFANENKFQLIKETGKKLKQIQTDPNEMKLQQIREWNVSIKWVWNRPEKYTLYFWRCGQTDRAKPKEK